MMSYIEMVEVSTNNSHVSLTRPAIDTMQCTLTHTSTYMYVYGAYMTSVMSAGQGVNYLDPAALGAGRL